MNWTVIFAIAAVLQVLDVVTTRIGLARNLGEEANPIQVRLMRAGGVEAWPLKKWAIAAMGYGLIWLIDSSAYPGKHPLLDHAEWLAHAANAAMAGVVLWNARQVFRR